jgi:hypothetical protein
MILFHLRSTRFIFGFLSQNYVIYNNRILDWNSKNTITEGISDSGVLSVDVYKMSLWNAN